MNFAAFTPIPSLVGGILIGLSAALLLLGVGRIAGISGIAASAVTPLRGEDGAWRWWFLAGLFGGGLLLAWLWPATLGAPILRSIPMAVLAAVLVGVGVELGAGCTSGHGVCGIGRFSPRSIAATVTFIATGVLTVLVMSAVSPHESHEPRAVAPTAHEGALR